MFIKERRKFKRNQKINLRWSKPCDVKDSKSEISQKEFKWKMVEKERNCTETQKEVSQTEYNGPMSVGWWSWCVIGLKDPLAKGLCEVWWPKEANFPMERLGRWTQMVKFME